MSTTKPHNANESVKLNTAESLNICLAKKYEELLEGQKHDGNNMPFDLKWKIDSVSHQAGKGRQD